MTRWLVAAAGLVLAAVLVFVWRRDAVAPTNALAPAVPGARDPRASDAQGPSRELDAPLELVEPAHADGARDALPGPGTAATRPPAVATAPFVVRGRVLDTEGEPIARAPLERDGSGTVGIAAADGSFAFELEGESTLGVRSPAYVTVLPARARAATDDAVVVVAKKTRLFGRVRAADGRPVAGAALTGRVPSQRLARWLGSTPRSSDASEAARPSWHAETDATGRFAFDAFPALVGVVLTVEASGFQATSIELDETKFGAELDVVVAR